MQTIHELVHQDNRQATGKQILAELRAQRAELHALRQLFDHFAGTFLNAKFPHGRPVDRWAHR
jgi:hypothetical protein